MKKNTSNFLLLISVLIFSVCLFVKCSDNKTQAMIKAYAALVNQQCPMVLDQYSALDKCTVDADKTITFNYIVDFSKLGITVQQLEERMKTMFILNIKTVSELKELRENNVIFQYRFKNIDKSDICTFTLSPEEYNRNNN